MIKQLILMTLFLSIVLPAKGQSQDSRDAAELTIFHSNDIYGYLTPCG